MRALPIQVPHGKVPGLAVPRAIRRGLAISGLRLKKNIELKSKATRPPSEFATNVRAKLPIR